MRLTFLTLLLLIGLPPQSATAAWHEASSDHFVIYAEASQKTVSKYAHRLERFHDAMVLFFAVDDIVPSPSNRIVIYATQNDRELRLLYGQGEDANIGSFYIARAGGSFGIVSRLRTGKRVFSFSETTLLYHYAQHFLTSASEGTYPRWISAGFALFCAQATFEFDGSVGIGWAIKRYVRQLNSRDLLPIDIVLDSDAYEQSADDGDDTFFPQAWLLYHYLQFSPTRIGQLTNYLQQLADGSSELDAARAAFGDLQMLELDLKRYAKSRNFGAIGYSAEGLHPGKIVVRQLGEAEAAILPIKMRSQLGVNPEQAKEVFELANVVAKQYPDDPIVLEAMSEALVDTGQLDQAIEVAERAIAIDGTLINAHIQKGRALAKLAREAGNSKSAWLVARKQAIVANGIENDHPVPLIQYYNSYSEAGETPTSNAFEGLLRGVELAPFDPFLRYSAAVELVAADRLDEARKTLGPLINSAHDPQLMQGARDLRTLIEDKMANDLIK